MALFGPGVTEVIKANTANANKRSMDNDMDFS
jgi:hypothetical protein